jgi:glucose uptake protein GlcU
MWLPGALCGALWEVSNIGSLVSVQFLGEGVGFSVVQAALLVSGTFLAHYKRYEPICVF